MGGAEKAYLSRSLMLDEEEEEEEEEEFVVQSGAGLEAAREGNWVERSALGRLWGRR